MRWLRKEGTSKDRSSAPIAFRKDNHRSLHYLTNDPIRPKEALAH